MFYIRGRKNWNAKPLNGEATYQHPSTVKTLVLHHTAGYAPQRIHGAIAEMQGIDRQHKAQEWIGIGYNVVIDRQGNVWEGRGINFVGAHTKGHNTGSFGISFMGDYSRGKLRLNRRQKLAYRALRANLRTRGFRFKSVKGHKEMPGASTACPGDIKKDLGLV